MSSALADTTIHTASETSEPTRRDFINILATTSTIGAAVAVAWPLIDQLNPAADTLAMASIEYDLTKVALGQEVTISWRKQPVFVRHRTPAEIARAVADDHAPMKDPATDASRVKPGHEEWLIVLASCTHLGCVPTFAQGEYGGWLCPCHGSVYDTAARIRKGPAPKNLFLPDYTFLSDTKVKIG
ncbi:MAG TPA: ubiquinol-cytochrome c reductase iron-sulfur subunit [Caulobacteraceae bacterium]|nr:ubiquinol-cytochrome c reductase iron-sulfur subunit [Caulobacteraceae bacterium]